LARFVENDPDLASSWRLNTTVNKRLAEALLHDKEKKIKAWCFGHYHWPVDETVDGVRYVCNPLGRENTPWYRSPYFAKRIEV
jgi:predicted phosphodiesterase